MTVFGPLSTLIRYSAEVKVNHRWSDVDEDIERRESLPDIRRGPTGLFGNVMVMTVTQRCIEPSKAYAIVYHLMKQISSPCGTTGERVLQCLSIFTKF
jgi:hypothetical protein